MRTVRQKRSKWIVEEDGKVINYFYEKSLAYELAGIPMSGDSPEPEPEVKLAGAIVEENILEADLDGDGVIERAELKTWLQESDER